MTQRRIILLTSGREAPYFKSLLREQNPDLDVINVDNLRALEDAVRRVGGAARLISFLTDVIAPKRVLAQLTLTPYNIHPGPPEYPGAYPECWAIWERARLFGVTAHEIIARVDAGPIVAALRYPMPADPERIALNDHNYREALKVFTVVAAHCAASDQPMAPIGEKWGKNKRTRAEFQALCRAPDNLDPDDLARLRAACGPDFAKPGGRAAAGRKGRR